MALRHDLRPRTADDYRDIIRVHIDPLLGDKPLEKLTPSDVRNWYAAISAKVPGRARKDYRLLRTIPDTAVADEIIPRNPCRVRGAGQDRSAERPIATVAQVTALADAVDHRLRALVLLAAWCGLRRADLLALRRREVDLLRGTVRVERSMHTLAAATRASTKDLMARMGHASPQASLIYQHATADRAGPSPTPFRIWPTRRPQSFRSAVVTGGRRS